MPDKMKPKGYYTMAELKGQKAGKQNSSPRKESLGPFSAPSISEAPIGPSRPKPISIEETYFSTAKANKPLRPEAKKVSAPVMKGIGSKEIDSPTPFRTEQQGNLSAMASNFNKPSEKETKKSNRKVARQVNKSIRQGEQIERVSKRQKRRADSIIKRESQGMDASIIRSKLKTGAQRLNKLRNK